MTTFHTAEEIFSRFCGLISGHFLNGKLFGYLKDLRDRMPAIFPWKSQGREELCKLDPWLSIEESTLVFLGTLRLCLLAILTHKSQILVANHKKFCFIHIIIQAGSVSLLSGSAPRNGSPSRGDSGIQTPLYCGSAVLESFTPPCC